MGLCKCAKRKVTNLFCFEHDVNVCEYCLVADHERCIVQSYVQWLQDSDYNPICILCRNLLKDQETVRLICYDVFHLSCIDKYATQYPSTTAPAGYQCPKCKECIFPPPNFASPVVDALKQKIQNFTWSRIGLGQSLLPLVDSAVNLTDLETTNQIINQSESNTNDLTKSTNIDDEFVIVNDNKSNETINTQRPSELVSEIKQELPQINQEVVQLKSKENIIKTTNLNIQQQQQQKQESMNLIYDEQTISHNRSAVSQLTSKNEQFEDQERSNFYDASLGIVLNMNNYNDRDTGDYKYQRRPLFEWLNRWLKSRQLLTRVRMTRQKKYLFIVLLVFISLFTLIIIFSRLGTMSTDDDPMFDPMNNPNIHIQ